MALSENLIKHLAQGLNKEIDNSYLLNTSWQRIDFEGFLKQKIKLDFTNSQKEWLDKAKELKIEHLDIKASKEKIADLIFRKLRTELKSPTFIINQPLAISPLAKKDPQNPQKTLRFLLVINGWEIANGFSELNNPLDQKERFNEQAKLKKAGDIEAHPQDIDFIEALEYGMPPAAGLGIGIDRLIAVLTHAPNLKEVIFFPFLKPRK